MFDYSRDEVFSFAAYFKKLANESYVLGEDGNYRHRPEAFATPQWLEPEEALKKEFKNPHTAASIQFLEIEKNLISDFVKWLDDSEIDGLSHYGNGDLASVFEARGKNLGTRCVVRLNFESDIFATHTIRVWSPFLIQPYKSIMLNEDLKVELLPLVKVIQDEDFLVKFGIFLGEHVAPCTPYMVSGFSDLGILFDGTPVYVDPDKLTFGDPQNFKSFMEDQTNLSWRQGCLERLDDLCQSRRLPEPLRWVVQDSDGKAITKQQALYLDPFSLTPHVRHDPKNPSSPAPA